MASAIASLPPARSSAWKWWVCSLLLLATMLNYMDRLTINQTSERIKTEFHLDNKHYGLIESVFALAFAFGALGSGWLVDHYNVAWFYPIVVLLWSLAGFVTGFAETYLQLLLFRFLLGLFESGHWPSALRTTQRILPPAERSMGNSILQSGASLGAVLTPLIVLSLLKTYNDWRPPFWCIGSFGIAWVALWLLSVRRHDLALPDWAQQTHMEQDHSWSDLLAELVRDRRFWALAVMVAAINAAWHFFRVWLPLFLRESRGYSEEEMNYFLSGYYLSADLGCLAAGALTLWLARRGLAVHRSRVVVFLAFAMLTLLSLVAATLPAGPVLLALLLVIAFGSLGVFPNYYSWQQELSVRHQGKVSGTLGFISWMAQVPLQFLAGVSIDATHSYTLGIIVAGLLPMTAGIVLVLLWRQPEPPDSDQKKQQEVLAAEASGA
jgi:ACS family hexuronate transporter-like MFS transporter